MGFNLGFKGLTLRKLRILLTHCVHIMCITLTFNPNYDIKRYGGMVFVIGGGGSASSGEVKTEIFKNVIISRKFQTFKVFSVSRKRDTSSEF